MSSDSNRSFENGSSLPEVWQPVSFGEAVLNVNGARRPISLAKRAEIKGEYPYYGATGQIDSLNDYTHEGEHVLIGEDGANLLSRSKDLAFLVTGKFWVNNHAHSIKALAQMPSSYIRYYINSLDLSPYVTGSAQPKLNKANLERIPFPLAPLAEQKVIADKLDELLTQVESTKARLDRIPDILKRFRQSVLAAAVSGKLTEEWREINSTSSVRKLIGEIKQTNPHKAKPYEPSEPPYEIDNSWVWCRLGDAFVLKSGKTVKAADEKKSGETPYFKVGDMNHIENQLFMNRAERYVEGNEKSLLPASSIIFPKRGGAISTNKKRILVKNSLVDLNTMGIIVPSGIDMMYVYVWFETVDLADLNTGSTIPQVNNGDIEPLWVPFPPIEEQIEIARRVEKFFVYADKVEQQVNQAQERVNKLTQSILAKAFRGELTEQWRKDNPDLISGDNSAEALLAKIKVEREAAKPKKKTRKKATA